MAAHSNSDVIMYWHTVAESPFDAEFVLILDISDIRKIRHRLYLSSSPEDARLIRRLSKHWGGSRRTSFDHCQIVELILQAGGIRPLRG